VLKGLQDRKLEHENYFRVLQGLLLRSLQVHASRTRQMSMYRGLVEALQGQRQSSEVLDTVLHQLCETPAAVSSVRVSGAGLQHPVTFTIGQLFKTPAGIGCLASLDPHKKQARLAVSGGSVQTYFDVLAGWPVLVLAAAEQSAVALLNAQWEDDVKDRVWLQPSQQREVRDLLQAHHGVVSDDDNDTDGDDATSVLSGDDGGDEDIAIIAAATITASANADDEKGIKEEHVEQHHTRSTKVSSHEYTESALSSSFSSSAVAALAVPLATSTPAALTCEMVCRELPSDFQAERMCIALAPVGE
jgi:hypothetical protein